MPDDLEQQPLGEAEARRRELYRQQMTGRLSAQPLSFSEKLAVARRFSKIPKPGEIPEAARSEEFSPETVAAYLKGARAKAGVQVGAAGGAGGATGTSPMAGGVGQAGKTGTAKLLQQSWANLLDSFGLTYFYILFHFICRYIGQLKIFCRFGEEWLGGKGGAAGAAGGAAGAGGATGAGAGLAKAGAGAGAAGKAPTAGGGQGGAPGISKTPMRGSGQGVEAPAALTEAAGQAISVAQDLAEYIEIAAFGLLTFLLGVIILILLVIIYYIVHPCELVNLLAEWASVAKPLAWVIRLLPICTEAH